MNKIKFDELTAIIDKLYNADVLNKLYSEYLKEILDVIDEKGTRRPIKLKKTELTNYFSLVLSNKKFFDRFLSLLPEDVKKILNIIVWEGDRYPAEKFINEFGSDIIINKGYSYGGSQSSHIRKQYLLFNFDFEHSSYSFNFSSLNPQEFPYKVTIFLDDNLRTLFKTYLPKPEWYELHPIELIEKTDFIYSDDNYIVKNIELLKNYILQGYLKTGANGKVLKTAIQQMANYCHIKEFYAQSSDEKDKNRGRKELQCLRTELLIHFLMLNSLKANYKSDNQDEIELLKSLFVKFFYEKHFDENTIFNRLMSYLKGYIQNYSYDQDRRYKVKKGVTDILKAFPIMKWLSVYNIAKYAKARDIFIEIVDNEGYYFKKLSVNINTDTMKKKYSYTNEVDIKNLVYEDAVTLPFIKGVLFLMASFGIVDIAYNYPANSKYQQIDKPYLTEYDGLEYVRLTELGAYILGIKDSYNFAIEKDEISITLDDNRLMMQIEGNDLFKQMLLEKLAEKVYTNTYRVTYSSFLKDCTSIKDVEQKIKLFKKHISSKPSEIWQKFFKDVQGKINPLSPKKSLVVYEIQPSGELVSLIAKDEILRKYILKAEKYHIVFDSANRFKVKNRLEEFGFFIDNI